MMRRHGLIGAALTAMMLSTPAWAQQTAQTAAHHSASVHIDPDQNEIRVHDTITLSAKGDVTLSLSPAFSIDALAVDGRPTPVRRDGENLTLALSDAEQHDITLSYHGTGKPLLTSEGGFVEASWLAQPDGALATWSIKGQTPAGQKFVLPGRLVDETTGGASYTAEFENLTPSEPPVLITGPFVIREKWSGKNDDIRLRTYFHPELDTLADGYLGDTASYIEYYVGKIGAYPYPGFSIISGPAPVGWGLPGMTYIGRRVLALPFIRHTSLPHEILHNWWGNAVEVDYQGGNWAEGLTTYQADHDIAEMRKKGGGREKRFEWLRNYAALPPARDHALTAFRSKTHDASQVVGYGKTAFVFHMLNTQLGADVFDKSIQRFNRDNHFKVAGWADIQTAFETVSGQNLTAFFKAWVTRPGAPSLRLDAATADANGVHLTLKQDQDGPAYPLTVPIDIDTAHGTERHTVLLDQKSQSYTFAVGAKAYAVRVDPDTDVFRRLSPGEAPPILRDVTLDPNARLVALGGAEMRALAQNMADHLLQSHTATAGDAKTLIIAGPTKDVRAYLADNTLPPTPDEIANQGDTRAWTARTVDGRTLLVAETQDETTFKALARILPHYKGRSFVVMEKSRTTAKGTWPPTRGPLTARLD